METSIPAIVNRESFVEGLRLILGNLTETKSGIALATPPPDSDQRPIKSLSYREIDEVIDNLRRAKANTASAFYWADRAEFTLVPLNGPYERFFDDTPLGGQGDDPVSYRIGDPSKEVIAYMACYVARNKEVVENRRWSLMRQRKIFALRKNIFGRGEGDKSGTIWDVVDKMFRITALHISSNRTQAGFESLANSFLFHVAYNTDMAARIGIDPMLELQLIQRVRRSSRGSLDAPRKSYDSDLVRHYTMGVAAEIPLLEYLSYYHIAEHYFERVFNDDLVGQVQQGITDPSFSVRRARDVQGLIKVINRAQRQVREEGGVNEQRSLKLVLDRFVNVDRLIDDLRAYDANLIAYYRDQEVSWAGAKRVDLEKDDQDAVRDAAAKRIYKVRNALVHAKEGEFPKYAPFAHDAELSREIPLMRFTAEQIIIAHGRVL